MGGGGILQKCHCCPHAAFKIPPILCSSSSVRFTLLGKGELIFCQSSSLIQLTASSDECQSPCKCGERAVGGSHPSLQQQLARANTAVLLIRTLRFSTKHRIPLLIMSKSLEISWLDSRHRPWLNQKATPVPLNRFYCWLQNPCKLFMFWVDLSFSIRCLSFPSFCPSDFKPHMI